MSVKKKDRHISKLETLEKSRTLMDYLLTLTRPAEYDDMGKQIMKPGLLGGGQAFTIFGADMVKCGKMIHSCCYQATQLNLNEKNYEEIQKYYRQAIEYCDSIMRQIDFCVFKYAKKNKKKAGSLEHLSKLTLSTKRTIQDRINRNHLILVKA